MKLLLALFTTLCLADEDKRPVGMDGEKIILPVSQTLTPAGEQTELPGLRPVAIALSPDGRLLATAGKTSELIVLDLQNERSLQRVHLPDEKILPEDHETNELKPDRSGQISYTGLVFSPDGKRIYLSNVHGSIKVFNVQDGQVTPSGTWPLPGKAAPGRGPEVPAGLACNADGSRLYVCGSLSNKLFEIESSSGKILREFTTGMVPWQVAVRDGYAHVTNRAGSRPLEGDKVETTGRGVDVKVETSLSLPGGSVTSINLETGESTEILVGRQPGALAVSPDGNHLVIANADDDTLTILPTSGTNPSPATTSVRWRADDPFGASPTAMTFIDDDTLLVALGTQNAIGVFEFEDGKIELEGMIPTGWFPSGISWDAGRKTIHVSNLKGLGSGLQNIRQGKDANSHNYFGSLSHIPRPDKAALKEHTARVLDNYRVEAVRRALLPPRPDQKPVPVPARSGEPSVFKHVIYIIRENRTYDQVLGDMKEGNGKAELCIFGEQVTPNVHGLARGFVLLDNTYCSGILSADGHNWSLTAFANDYLERSFAGFPRAYPDGLGENDLDVLAWSPAGFLWTAAKNAGRTCRVYGEMCVGETSYTEPGKPGSPDFTEFYRDFKEGTKTGTFTVRPGHATVEPHLARDYPAWADEIPDQTRASVFINHMQACESGEGEFENFHILSLPNDHTSGTKPGHPTPAACVADNDLALGRIVEAVSHSKYWPETVIFTIEDDPQAGWDHVSGYRTVCLVASPYTKRGEVISTHYNQPGLIRTIGLILGFPPLNQMDAASTPMRDCFQETADLTPYTAKPNQIPLDQLNPATSSITNPTMRALAEQSGQLPLDRIDACDEDTLNRILWHAMKGPDAAYPLWAVIPEDDRLEDDDDD